MNNDAARLRRRWAPGKLAARHYHSVPRVITAVVAAGLAACVSVPTPDLRRQEAVSLAQTRHWHATEVSTSTFKLQAFIPDTRIKSPHLTVYLEGDGFAWISSSQPSTDPTPINPVALRLALTQPSGNAVYLARPCQYQAEQDNCRQRYWTQARFADEVVVSLNQAIDTLKTTTDAQHLTLVGYSGGAALAMLVAVRRNDVRDIITVAGNLDHAAWTDYHHVRPLDESLNPVDQIAALANIRQVHLSGADDTVTPPVLTTRFVAAFPEPRQAIVRIIPGYTHQCCWAQDWPMLWKQLPAAAD